MSFTQGYPSDADIQTFLSARGIEPIEENNSDFYTQFLQMLWAIHNRQDWAGALAVYPATATTFKVAGGSYVWRGTVKTYTSGSAIDPTDNDTTYVWMKSDGTIGYDIDANGWPSTEHLKLAEVVVNSSGTITSITDLRGKWALAYNSERIYLEAKTSNYSVAAADCGKVFTNLGATGAITLTLPASPAAGDNYTFAVQAAQELRVDPGTATIRDDSGQTADKYKACSTIGACLKLVADSNGDWVTIAKNGTWTEEV